MRLKTFEKILKTHAHLPAPQDAGFVALAKAEMEITPRPIHRHAWRTVGFFGSGIGVMAAVMVFMILGFRIQATVTLDINPSLVLKVNHFDYVIDISAQNAEGEAVLEAMNSQRGTVENILGAILETSEALGYLSAEHPSAVLLGVSAATYETEQKIERIILDTWQTEELTTLFLNKHDEHEALLFSGLVLKSASGFEDFFAGIQESDSLTTTYATTTIPAWPDSEDIAGSNSNVRTPDYSSLTESEFQSLIEEYAISEAKLTLAILVFNGNDSYILSADLEYLCNLSIEQLISLYEALN